MENGQKEPFVESNLSADHHEIVADTETENYQGLRVRTVLVYLSLELITFAQILNLIGSGAYSRYIALAVGGSTQAVWLTQSIAILTCVLGIPISQAADYWGRKWLLVITTILGFAGSMIVARSTSMGMAIAGEVINGISFGSQPLLYAVSSEILPRRFRPAAQGGINAAISLAGIFSLLVGFTLVKDYSNGFRIYFYITASILALSAIICGLLYNPPLRDLQKSLTFRQKIGQLDWAGYALLTSGIVLFSMALSWSENPFSWKNPHVFVTFLIGLVLLLCLALHQTVLKKDGMFHHQLFAHDRNFALALLCITVEGMVFFSAINYFAFEVSVLYETDPFRVGLRFAITFFTSLMASFGIAVYSSFTRTVKLPTVFAFACFVIFNILMATAKTTSSTAVWAYPIFLGIGIGICLTCIVTAAQLSVPPQLIAISSGLVISIRSLGASISLAIYTAIFNSQINKHLGPDIASAVLPLGLSPKILPQFIAALAADDTKALVTLPGVTPQIIGAGVEGLKTAYLSAFRYVWVFAGVLSFLACIGACFFVDAKKDFNMHVDAPLDQEN